MIVLGALARMSQNLNFAPVGAISLFAGARLRGWQAYALPILLMAATDPFLGGYSFATPFVYASFLLNVWIGSRLRNTEKPWLLGAAAMAGSVQFFLISNFAVWVAPHSHFARSIGGLGACYTVALPFFRGTLISDLVYTAVFFGLHALLSRTVVRSERVAATV
jgi:hypothetical protein